MINSVHISMGSQSIHPAVEGKDKKNGSSFSQVEARFLNPCTPNKRLQTSPWATWGNEREIER